MKKKWTCKLTFYGSFSLPGLVEVLQACAECGIRSKETRAEKAIKLAKTFIDEADNLGIEMEPANDDAD